MKTSLSENVTAKNNSAVLPKNTVQDINFNLRNEIEIIYNVVFAKHYVQEGSFHEGYVRVIADDGTWNFVSKENKLVSPEWFVRVSDFVDGSAYVEREGGLANHMKADGTFCFQWYELEE